MTIPIPSDLTYKLSTYCFMMNHRQGIGIQFLYNTFHLGENIGKNGQVVCSRAAFQLDSTKNFQNGHPPNSQCGNYVARKHQRLIKGVNASIALLNFQYNPHGIFDHRYVINITYEMQFGKFLTIF